MFYYAHCHQQGLSLEETSQKWSSTEETHRQRMLPVLKRAEDKTIHYLCKRRTATAYQLFMKDFAHSNRANKGGGGGTFEERSRASAASWRNMNDVARAPYIARSEKLKQERRTHLQELPPYMKRRVSAWKSLRRASARQKKRLCNPFILCLRERWKDECKRKADERRTYRQLMQEVSREWHVMTENQRRPYQIKFEENLARDDGLATTTTTTTPYPERESSESEYDDFCVSEDDGMFEPAHIRKRKAARQDDAAHKRPKR
jgi:hypothetical protein